MNATIAAPQRLTVSLRGRGESVVRPRRVLVVDDDPDHVNVLSAVLASRGYEIAVAVNGAAALAQAARSLPELILLDVDMPVLDGFATARRLMSDARTSDVPIMFVSASTDARTRVQGIELGAVDFISKPFFAPELLARVERSFEQLDLRRSLREAAHVDELTGLANLRLFVERFALEYARSKRYRTDLTLVMLDVDKLKAINDGQGHVTGNRVLAAIGRILHDEIRDTDLAARYGGDEFVVLLPHSSLDDGGHFADRVFARLAGPDWRETQVTISAGLASYLPDGATSMDELLRRADAAAYQAKRAGGNRAHLAR